MPKYRANWNALPNAFNSGKSSFRFQAGSDGDANTIVDTIDAALTAQLTTQSKYLVSATDYGAVHTAGTDRNCKITGETDAGAFYVWYLRNLTDAATAAGIEALFTAHVLGDNGDAITIANANPYLLKRGETEIPQK